MTALIYVVDDKSSMRESVVDTLVLAGYQVRGFEGVAATREAILNKAPDLIVTDLSMPDETGIDLVAWCRWVVRACVERRRTVQRKNRQQREKREPKDGHTPFCYRERNGVSRGIRRARTGFEVNNPGGPGHRRLEEVW